MSDPREHSRRRRGGDQRPGRTRRRSRRFLFLANLLALLVTSRLAMDGDPPTCLVLPLLSAMAFGALTLSAARRSPWSRGVAAAVSRRTFRFATVLAARRRDAALLRRLATLCRGGDVADRQDRIAILVGFVACRAGLGRSERRLLATASTLHRTGFMLLPPMPGTDHETRVRLAADIAGRLLDGHTPLHRAAVEMACAHDEVWDGSGYPGGLSGQAIPFSARVLQVGLALDALLPRTGRQPDHVKLTAITARIAAEAGRTLDPVLAVLPSQDVAKLARLLQSLPMPPEQGPLQASFHSGGPRGQRGSRFRTLFTPA